MLNRFAFVCAATVLVAGCGDAGDGNRAAESNAALAAPGAQATMAATLRPGQWEIASSGDVEGTEGVCITAEQVQRSSFVGNSLAGQPQCSVVRDRMAGGAIDVEIACGEGRHPMRMRGTYMAESFSMDSSLEMPVGGGRTETIQAQRSGRWVADQCAPRGESAEG